MLKNKYVIFCLHLAAFVVIWNLLDYLYSMYIAGVSFQFSAGKSIAWPAGLAVVTGYLLYLRKK